MASLSGPRPPTEVDLIQNPALGALLLWRFARTYQGEVAREVPLHLAFLVLPMVLHQGSRNEIVSTRKASGLTLFAAKQIGRAWCGAGGGQYGWISGGADF